MKKPSYGLAIVVAVALSSCSNRVVDNLSPSKARSATFLPYSDQKVFWSNEPHVHSNLSGVLFKTGEVAKLGSSLQDENGNALSSGFEVKPNTTYKIIVSKGAPCEVVIKQGIGFTLLSSSQEADRAVFVIKTVSEVPDRLVADLVPKSIRSRLNQQVYRSRPQQFLLPN